MSTYKTTSRFAGDMGMAALATTPKEVSSAKFEDVEQTFTHVSRYDKLKKLRELIQVYDGKRIIVFVKTKRNTDFVATMLCQQEILASSIHGDRVPSDRKMVRDDFRNGNLNVLVATSAVICGLDIRTADVIVNFDFPRTLDEYERRIELATRDGRGLALSFFDDKKDLGLIMASLAKTLRLADEPSPDILQDGGAGASQMNDTAAVTTRIATPHQPQSPETSNPTNDGGHMLLMTSQGPMIHWACTCSECLV